VTYCYNENSEDTQRTAPQRRFFVYPHKNGGKMNVLKHNIDKDFTVVSNVLLKSKLSAKAKGIFVQLISLPENWNFSVAGLAVLFTDGERSVKSGIDELVEAGFLTWERFRDENQRFSVKVTTIYPSEPHDKLPHGVSSTGQNATRRSADNKELKDKEGKVNKELTNKPRVAKATSKLVKSNDDVKKNYYETIKYLKLPVRNHKNMNSKIVEMKSILGEEKAINYLKWIAHNWHGLNGEFKPSLTDGADLWLKHASIENWIRKLQQKNNNGVIKV
jgi:hypothetical protein